jgi:FtsZ-binding cell division protein ZapB
MKGKPTIGAWDRMEKFEETPKCFVTVGENSAELAKLKEENANLLFKLSEISEHVKDFPAREELKYGNYTLVDRTELNEWVEKLRALSKKAI